MVGGQTDLSGQGLTRLLGHERADRTEQGSGDGEPAVGPAPARHGDDEDQGDCGGRQHDDGQVHDEGMEREPRDGGEEVRLVVVRGQHSTKVEADD